LARIKPQEDRAILMICIGIALVFWVLVKLSQVYRVWKPALVNVNVPEEMALTKMPPNNLMLRFEARGWDLLFNNQSLSGLVLDYSMDEEPELLISDGQLRSDIFETLSSPRIKVVDVNYNELYLRFEERLEKEVPVILRSKISFADGFNFSDDIFMEPDTITVSGPASLVKTVQYWQTDSLVLINLNKSIEKAVALNMPPRELKLSQKQVAVNLPVEKFTEKSFFIPLNIKNAPETDSLSIFPSSVNVSCVVGLSKYDDLEAEDIEFEVDLGETLVLEGKNTAPISLVRYPDFAQILNYSPKSATFFIIKKSQVPETEDK
jgi:hypothetical protein